MNLTLSLPRLTKAEVWGLLIVGGLIAGAILLSIMPWKGMGGHMHWVLWMVGTGRWDIPTGVAYILAALPGYIAAQPLIEEGVTWIVTWVASDGIGAIATIMATLSAMGWYSPSYCWCRNNCLAGSPTKIDEAFSVSLVSLFRLFIIKL